MALYDDWLDYVVHKLERRSGVRLELTSLERRWPPIFLWPRALRFLIARRSGPVDPSRRALCHRAWDPPMTEAEPTPGTAVPLSRRRCCASATSRPSWSASWSRSWGSASPTSPWVGLLAAAHPALPGLGLARSLSVLANVMLAPVLLFAPFTGAWVDRWNLKRVMIVSDLLRAVLVLGSRCSTPPRTARSRCSLWCSRCSPATCSSCRPRARSRPRSSAPTSLPGRERASGGRRRRRDRRSVRWRADGSSTTRAGRPRCS